MAALCLASRGSPTETTSPLHQLDPARAPSLAEERLLLPVEARNILHLQCLDWNAKPVRGGGAFRKQRNMQWRMVSQHGVQFCVVGGGGTRDVERRLDRRVGLKGEAAVQRGVKDEPEIEIDRVERR